MAAAACTRRSRPCGSRSARASGSGLFHAACEFLRELFLCSLIWNRVPIFCNPHSFDHIIARSVNRRQPGTERRGEEEPMGWNGSTIRCLVAALALSAACPPFALAQSAEKNAAVYLYEGGDRTQRLAGRAREEGTLVLYTSLATSESVPLTHAFQKKYGIKVELWRSLSDQVVQRVLNEARARRHNVDVVETNGPELEALARERVTARFFSPYIADIPAWGVPAHRMWISDRVDFFVVAFNTVKVRREELPATYEGFLDSKWKGRVGLEATDQEWLAGLAKHWGEKRALEFFRRLAANAPHPNAALLFADFLLSPEGQQLLSSMGRFPSSQKVKSNIGAFPYLMLDPVTLIDEDEKWLKLWNELVAAK